jgi:hypothetical protein
MNPSAGLLNFGTKDPTELVLEMYRIRQRILLGEQIEMPLVTLLISPEGTQVDGYILDVNTDAKDRHVSVQLGSGDIFYTKLPVIQGIVIRNIERYESVLTEVTVNTIMNIKPTTSKLRLRQHLDQQSESLSEKIKSPIAFKLQGDPPDNNMSLFILQNLITDIAMCLKELALTEIGRTAIAGEIKTVVLKKSDEEFTVQKVNAELIILSKFEKSYTTSRGRDELKEKLLEIL